MDALIVGKIHTKSNSKDCKMVNCDVKYTWYEVNGLKTHGLFAYTKNKNEKKTTNCSCNIYSQQQFSAQQTTY